jgi:hypothetical protein
VSVHRDPSNPPPPLNGQAVAGVLTADELNQAELDRLAAGISLPPGGAAI